MGVRRGDEEENVISGPTDVPDDRPVFRRRPEVADHGKRFGGKHHTVRSEQPLIALIVIELLDNPLSYPQQVEDHPARCAYTPQTEGVQKIAVDQTGGHQNEDD